MDSTIHDDIDFNNPTILQLYSELLLFKNDFFRNELLFSNPDKPKQRILQALAHKLDLECEYTLTSRTVRICRSLPEKSAGNAADSGSTDLEYFWDLNDIDPWAKDDQHPSDQIDVPVNPSSSNTLAELSNTHNWIDYLNSASLNTASIPSNARPFLFSHADQQKSETGDDGRHQSFAALKQITSPFQSSKKRSRSQRSVSPTDPGTRAVEFRPWASSSDNLTLPGASCGIVLDTSKDKHVDPRLIPPQTGIWTPTCETSVCGPESVHNLSRGPTGSETPPDLGRRCSVDSTASSGYQEIIFDSGRRGSASQISIKSCGSGGSGGRTGPLSQASKAAMNAVRKVGACWKCKFLRKTCDEMTPCAICQVGDTPKVSNWGLIGCKRHSLKSNMLPLKLCQGPLQPKPQTPRFNIDPAVEPNAAYSQGLKIREQRLLEISQQPHPYRECDNVRVIQRLLNLGADGSSYMDPKILPSLGPLNQCAAAIIYELNRSNSPSFITRKEKWDELPELLLGAAQYQARSQSQNDQLIAQSFICLRSCLEVFYLRWMNHLVPSSHVQCVDNLCKVTCVENLQSHIERYLDELSNVFFTKNNMLNKSYWWLSAFYSFCIQGYVRKILLDLDNPRGKTPEIADPTTQDPARWTYLHVPISLFIASSNTFDPIIHGCMSGKRNVAEPTSEIREVRSAVNQKSWDGKGIKSSAEYLKLLFEM